MGCGARCAQGLAVAVEMIASRWRCSFSGQSRVLRFSNGGELGFGQLTVKFGRGMVQEMWSLVFDPDGDGYHDNDDYYGGHNDYLIETE